MGTNNEKSKANLVLLDTDINVFSWLIKPTNYIN